ncbi:MAG: metallophosphoesterase [Phycisphaerales bacterium]|nr:MAG: metallophosphoesterase [Phycisphaerales bacterium]
MADIAYVCLSDMHFGEEDSLLTNLRVGSSRIDTSQPSAVLKQLVRCLKFLISQNRGKKKPKLILNGDILELALCSTKEAAMAFERFVELTMKKGQELFGSKIVYIPGNHDHHLWETAREKQYTNHIGRSKKKQLDEPWRTTSMFVATGSGTVPSGFLTTLVQRRFPEVAIEIAYPNLGLLNQDASRCVVFHHGHFLDPLYRLMTTLRTLAFPKRREPLAIWDIEAENFAWIDFFWSTLGRSGEAGKAIERVYEKMYDPKQFKTFLHDFIDNLDHKYDLPSIDWVTNRILKGMATAFVKKQAKVLERKDVKDPLSNKIEDGLRWYIDGTLREQIRGERDHKMPRDVTFVFGHTHKPFSRTLEKKTSRKAINAYNTGGWVVESVKPQPLHGGTVMLVDKDLNCAHVRLYNEEVNPLDYAVNVEVSLRDSKRANPLLNRISSLVNPAGEPWSTFSSLVSEETEVRRKNLEHRIRA